MTQISTGGYVRHRDRMVQESVFEDLNNTLIACRWKVGTTTRPLLDPNLAPSSPRVWTAISTQEDQVLRLVGKNDKGDIAQVVLIDAFPEASGTNDRQGQSRKTEVNTLAIDTGVAQEPRMVELGSNMMEQSYVFTLAFYAASDAVAMALLNDLRDRYQGRIVNDDHVDLYNFNDPTYSVATSPVTRMEVDYFRYSQDAERVTPWEVHLYYAELQVTDFIDESDPAASPNPGPDGSTPPVAQATLAVGQGAPTAPYEPGAEYLDLSSGDIYGSGTSTPLSEVLVGQGVPTEPAVPGAEYVDLESGDVYEGGS